MIDTKAIKAAAEAATPQPWIDPGEGNMPFICMMTPATVIALCDEVERLTIIASELQDLCDRQAKRLAEAEKDAARYQWLRSEHERFDPLCHLAWKQNSDRRGSEWVNTANLDNDIDAAMDAKP